MPEAAALRRLVEADLDAYKALRDAMLSAHPEAFTSDAESDVRRTASSYRERLGMPPLADGRFTLGAWRGNELLGALSCERGSRSKVQHIGHLVGMMVLPHVQRRGIGQRLLSLCIEEAKRAVGLEMLTLSVTASNAVAVALYRRNGFSCYGTLPQAMKTGAAYHAKDLMLLHLYPNLQLNLHPQAHRRPT